MARKLRKFVLVLLAASLAAVPAAGAAGTFAEPTTVLHTFQSASGTGSFGFAVSELADVNGDGAMEAIVGEPSAGPGGLTPSGSATSTATAGRTISSREPSGTRST